MDFTNQWPLAKAQNAVGGAADEGAGSVSRQQQLCGCNISHHALCAVSAALLTRLILQQQGLVLMEVATARLSVTASIRLVTV